MEIADLDLRLGNLFPLRDGDEELDLLLERQRPHSATVVFVIPF